MVALLSATAAAGPAPTTSPFSKAPYLQAPGPTTMTLVWESLENLPAKVRYGRGRRLDQVQEVAPPRTLLGVSTLSRTNVEAGVRTNVTSYAVTNAFYVYEALLSDLRPDTSYTYVVELGSQKSPRSRFRTFGQSPAEVRFVVYGDSRSQPKVHAAVARRFRQQRPDFILHTGDLVGRGRDYGLWARDLFDPLAGIIDHIPLLPTIGNHEEDGTNYLAYFHLPPPERWYAFDLGPVHVLTLDYHFERAAHEQFAFAQQDLRSSQAPWKVVFLHVPMFNVGGHGSTWGHDAYLPLFHETHVDVVVAGHSHVYERFRPVAPRAPGHAWPIVHITSGGGGASLYPVYDHPALASRASANHFIVFEATADRLKGRACLPSGKTLDRFELRKPPNGLALGAAAQAYPEEWLRTYFEAAPVLRGRVTSLPSNASPAQVVFTLRALTNAPGPVELEIRLAPDSTADYDFNESPLRVSLPAVGQTERSVQAQIRATGRRVVSAETGAALSPPLVFEARLRSGELDVLARGSPSIFSP
jgi:acid phosphatase type 7